MVKRGAKIGHPQFNTGRTYWKKRQHVSPNTEFKKGIRYSPMYEFKKGQNIGTNNCNWNNGSSFKPYPIEWTQTLKRSIRERDGYVCRLCGKTQIEELEKLEKRLHIHHIDYDKKNCNPINLITLCCSCNIKVNFNREYWINHFKGR